MCKVSSRSFLFLHFERESSNAVFRINLVKSIKAFLDAFDDIDIVLVLPEEYLGLGQEIVDAYLEHENEKAEIIDVKPKSTKKKS